ncbi:efflux RND transporter periplasmic adaptor subunit [Maricurvus nonylphenolicus]|uniref:efflux RND transporter periplasmic adaptor subunit n=1 Tax=Maricurvus nonylphenolicus TaxID=1008307 RepID=UPI0036F444D6
MQVPPSLTKLPAFVIILLVGALLVLAVATLHPNPEPIAPTAPKPIQVNVVLATPKTEVLTVRSQGTVAPKREIDLVAQVAGRITEVSDNFVNGGFFSEGTPLVNIDPRDYELASIRANARVAQAQQDLATNRGQARQARREWRDLGNDDANDLFLRKPQVAAAEANLASAKAERDQAKLDLQRTKISVPFNGRVRETLVDLGQYVTPGSRIATVYDTSVAEIRLSVTDRQAALLDLPLGFRGGELKQGPEVTIKGTIAGKQYQWQGRIARTDASIDTRSRLYYAVAEVVDPFVANPGSTQVPLIVGLFVEAEIRGRELDNVISIPKQALFKGDQIYVLDDQQRAHQQTVNVLHTDANTAWIQAEITSGTPIVIERQSYLSEGIVVTPLSEAKEPIEASGHDLIAEG